MRKRAYAPRRFWTDAEVDRLRERYATTPTAQIAAALGRSLATVYNMAAKLGLKKSAEYLASPHACRLRRGDNVGAESRFPKGHVPANKGLRRPGWAPGAMSRTQFKPGNRPQTWVPVGSYRINSDGYLDRKVTDTRHSPRDWVGVHRIVWMAVHGPIPEGHVVVFRPGRRTTDVEAITIDVLECITRRELMKRNTVHRMPKELARVVQLRGALVRQINKRTAA